jgi:hypothetical protein
MVRCAASVQIRVQGDEQSGAASGIGTNRGGDNGVTFMESLRESGWWVILKHCDPDAMREAMPAFTSGMYHDLWRKVWSAMSANAVRSQIDAILQVIGHRFA